MTDTDLLVHVDWETREVRLETGKTLGRIDAKHHMASDFATDRSAGFPALRESATEQVPPLGLNLASDNSGVRAPIKGDSPALKD